MSEPVLAETADRPDRGVPEAGPGRGPGGVFRTLRGDSRFWLAIGLMAALAVMAIWPQALTIQDPNACHLGRSLGRPTVAHPFGFDLQGCDYFSRSVHGARASLLIGVLVAGAAAVVAVVLGAAAGYFGGFTDAAISRAADVWFSVPIILGGMFFLTLLERRGVVQVILVLALMAWPAMVRLMRASVLETSTEEYVLAARALGASHWRILVRHIVPNSLRPLTVYGALFTATAIAAEAILSFMGVGLQLPTLSWGLMLADVRYRLGGNPHLLLPGVFLAAAVFAFVLLSDALRDALDPTTT